MGFAALDVRLERELGAVHKQLHLHSWILALVAASTVVPAVSALLGYYSAPYTAVLYAAGSPD
jgi:uncharacterized membrane protein required for colicin V production